MAADLAYTIGNEASYDRSLATKPETVKVGRYTEEDGTEYEGGCVWRTVAEAVSYLKGRDLPYKAAVYELKLPAPFEDVTAAVPHPGATWRALLVDARIVRKVHHDGC